MTRHHPLVPVKEYVHEDTLSCRLRTTEMPEAEPFCLRVGGISWDSGFRVSGLMIEDRILGIDGVRFDASTYPQWRHKAIGQYAENQYWKEAGAREGQVVTLDVKRDREILRIRGALVSERSWSDDNGRRLLSPTGPEGLARDGFDSPWSSWYERAITDPIWKLIDGANERRINTRLELNSHREHAARVAFLLEKYPGNFADAVAADYRMVETFLLGRRYEITPADLEWRSLGDARAAQIAAAGEAARKEFLAKHAPLLLQEFPRLDAASTDDRAAVTGRIVALPSLTNRNWLMTAGQAWLYTNQQNVAYFVSIESDAMRRLFTAAYRYRKSVRSSLTESHRVIGRIKQNPKMFVSDGSAVTGLELEPLGVSVGTDLFVDLTQVRDGVSVFAGEPVLANLQLPMPPADASPAEVMTAFFHCLKLGEEDEWRTYFATWEAGRWDDRVYYHALRPPSDQTLSSEWIRARRVISNQVFDVRPYWTGETSIVVEAGALEGSPRVERVWVQVDHIGQFDGEYRSFVDVNVHRMWQLQRVNGGPWRIAADSQNGI